MVKLEAEALLLEIATLGFNEAVVLLSNVSLACGTYLHELEGSDLEIDSSAESASAEKSEISRSSR